jgi:hypothetical protein
MLQKSLIVTLGFLGLFLAGTAAGTAPASAGYSCDRGTIGAGPFALRGTAGAAASSSTPATAMAGTAMATTGTSPIPTYWNGGWNKGKGKHNYQAYKKGKGNH